MHVQMFPVQRSTPYSGVKPFQDRELIPPPQAAHDAPAKPDQPARGAHSAHARGPVPRSHMHATMTQLSMCVGVVGGFRLILSIVHMWGRTVSALFYIHRTHAVRPYGGWKTESATP